MNNKKECPSCAMEVNAEEKVCPVCGYEFPADSGQSRLALVMLTILAVSAGLYLAVRFLR